MKPLKIPSLENLAVGLLFSVVFSALLAAVHVLAFEVPRILFVVMFAISLAYIAVVIFRLIDDPLKRKTYPTLLVNSVLILLFSISAIRLATSSFAEDDEIYSWNLWAVQHFEGKQADFKFTGVPYPQLFSYWIAALYHAMGSTVIHSVPRFFLAITTLIAGLAVVGIAKTHTWRSASITALILFAAIAPNAPAYTKGLADPLMTASMALSAWMLITYTQQPTNIAKLGIALACGVAASMTKQAGLLWMLALSILVLYGYFQLGWSKLTLVLTGVAVAASVVWPLFIAPGFINNQGVISASMANRSYGQQLVFSANKYLINHPALLILFLATFIVSWKHKFLRIISLVGIIPMMLAWFVFGAYSVRLGGHVLALAGVILVSALHSKSVKLQQGKTTPPNIPGNPTVTTVFSITLTAAYAMGLFFGIQSVAASSGTNLYDGAKTTLKIQFGDGSKDVIDKLLASSARVWTTSNYAYGPLYGRVPVGFPDYTNIDFNLDSLKNEILEFQSDYAIQSEVVAFGPASGLLKGLAQRCPDAFIPVLTPPNQKEFTLYKVILEKLAVETCR